MRPSLLTLLLGSIMGPAFGGSLVGIAVLSTTETTETIAVATLDPTTGGVAYSAPLTIEPSSAFCNAAFDADRGVYYVPSGIASILTVALDGTLIDNATLSQTYELPATQWDSTTGLLVALGMPGGTDVDAIAVNATSGAVSVIGRALLLRGVQLCEASWSATDATLLYLPNDRSTAPERSAAPGGVDDALITLNLTSGAVVSTVAYAAGLNAVSAWRPSWGPGTEQVLALSYLDTRPMELVNVDPATGNVTVLATLQAGLSPYQGDLALDAAGSTAWTVIGLNAPNGSFYPILYSFDLSSVPAKASFVPCADAAAHAGIWSLDWAAGGGRAAK